MSDYGSKDLARDLSLSANALARLDAYRTRLAEASAQFNLIGPKELDHFWRRHALDCAQLVSLAPDAKRWLDLGAGAGLPGLVIACIIADTPGARVDLIEATTKKARFLTETIHALKLPARVHNVRIESYRAGDVYDVVSARALAPLPRLIAYAKPMLNRGAQALFHKGENAEAELAAASEALIGGGYKADVLESVSDPRGRIIRITKAPR